MTRKKILALACAGFVLTLFVVACSPAENQKSAENASDTNSPAIEGTWSADSDCGTCHATEQASYDDSQCLASQHAEATCGECHNDTAALATVHEGAAGSDKMPKRLKATEVSDDTCLACHYGSQETLVNATPDAKVVDKNGTEVNPHQLPATPEHEAIMCEDCHAMHADEPIQEQADSTCQSCHHAEVFECHNCHE